MTYLIVCLSSGKGTWQEVKNLIKGENWEGIYLITDDFGVKKFSADKKVNFVVVNWGSEKNIIECIIKQLQGKIPSTEVALNLTSGTGNEHMAIISALLKLGLGIRFVALTEEGVTEI